MRQTLTLGISFFFLYTLPTFSLAPPRGLHFSVNSHFPHKHTPETDGCEAALRLLVLNLSPLYFLTRAKLNSGSYNCENGTDADVRFIHTELEKGSICPVSFL